MTTSSTRSVRNLPFWWRVTRYDPVRRDEHGAYRDVVWTSIADVGNTYDGQVLTREEYERVESAYGEAFLAFTDDARVNQLQVRDLQSGAGLADGLILTSEKAVDVVRRMLREEVVCRLESPRDDFALHVGFDLYMYVGSSRPCERAVKRTAELGLFAEPGIASPQLVND